VYVYIVYDTFSVGNTIHARTVCTLFLRFVYHSIVIFVHINNLDNSYFTIMPK